MDERYWTKQSERHECSVVRRSGCRGPGSTLALSKLMIANEPVSPSSVDRHFQVVFATYDSFGNVDAPGSCPSDAAVAPIQTNCCNICHPSKFEPYASRGNGRVGPYERAAVQCLAGEVADRCIG
jgi:hypothetical protein